MPMSAKLWQPTPERVAQANITAFTRRVAEDTGQTFAEYADLWAWSAENGPAFWRTLWDHFGIIGERGNRTLLEPQRMPGAQWFPDARLNFAENLLGRRAPDDNADALVFRGEDRAARRLSH